MQFLILFHIFTLKRVNQESRIKAVSTRVPEVLLKLLKVVEIVEKSFFKSNDINKHVNIQVT